MKLLASLVEIASTKIAKIGTSQRTMVEAVTETSSGNSKTAEVYGHFGMVSRPSRGTRGVRLRIGSLSIVVAAFRYDVEPPPNAGEVKFYSTDADGVVQSLHVLTADGKHVFNGGGDNAVRYNALATAFNQLKADFDNHVHAGIQSGTSSTVALIPSTADITGAKINDMEVPS